MSKKTYKKIKENKKKSKQRNKKNRKTRKIIQKGGDIMYYSAQGADKMWGLDQPTENLICSDESVCLAFGDVAEQVKAFFDGFVRFNYAKRVIKRIGNPSVNGFVFEIKNETRGYTAYSVLKSAQEPSSDNLMYEYHVGLYVNKLNKLFPCFVETYGLFKYVSEHQWSLFKDVPAKKIIDLHALQRALVLQPLDYAVGCPASKYMAVLIQHLPNPQTLDDVFVNARFIKDELMYALFQLYMPLARLMHNFTHYDLHLGNLLLYEPVVGKFIEYHYHYTPTWESSMHLTSTTRRTRTAHMASMDAETISFKSSYMLKIIDYGRSYFKDAEGGIDAKQVYDDICRTSACDNDTSDGTITCGVSYGLSWLEDNSEDPAASHFISSQHANISHDLLPLTRMYEKHKDKTIVLTPELAELGQKVIFNEYYGTEENSFMGYPKEINNVQDAATFIMNYIKRPDYLAHNNAVNRTKEKLGDLHIYMDGSRQMEFIPSIQGKKRKM
jgi:hypothetical protein